MKALAMLDHVMLWVARGFSIFILAWGIEQSNASHHEDSFVIVPALLGIIACASMCLLRVDAVRLMLALGSVASVMFVGAILLTNYSFRSDLANWMIDLGVPGFLAIFWTSVRQSFQNPVNLVNPV